MRRTMMKTRTMMTKMMSRMWNLPGKSSLRDILRIRTLFVAHFDQPPDHPLHQLTPLHTYTHHYYDHLSSTTNSLGFFFFFFPISPSSLTSLFLPVCLPHQTHPLIHHSRAGENHIHLMRNNLCPSAIVPSLSMIRVFEKSNFLLFFLFLFRFK